MICRRSEQVSRLPTETNLKPVVSGDSEGSRGPYKKRKSMILSNSTSSNIDRTFVCFYHLLS